LSRHYTHLLPILLLAWAIYGYCQEDIFLPLIAIGLTLGAHLLRLENMEKKFAVMDRIPLAAVFVFSLIAAIIWRILVPAPVTAGALYLEIISVWQSFTLIAGALLWLRPASLKNLYWLTGFSWATVALSINVPFDATGMLLFRLFCIFSVLNVLIHTFSRPSRQERYHMHLRQLLVFGLSVMVITGFFFKNIAFGLRVFDQMFMSLVGDYLLPRNYTNFLNISPYLTLTNPGYSAIDKRPVMEIDSMGFGSVYLKSQVFETYENGVWKEAKEVAKHVLPPKLDPLLVNPQIFMYVSLKDIVPVPYVVSAAEGHDLFSQDENGVVYAKENRRTRILSVSIIPPPPVSLDEKKLALLTSLPPNLEGPIKEIAAGIVSDAMAPAEKATALQDYFHDHFLYSLNVDFRADEKGLLRMLREKKPAYCSYFATALALLLRSQGIPARVAVGFSSSEKMDPEGRRLLVRVRNAHAWTEALVPYKDAATGQVYNTWVPFDATPSASMNEAIEDGSSRLNELADRLWLFILRSVTHLQNIEKEQLKRDILAVLVLILLLMNAKRIIRRLRGFNPFRSAGRERKTHSRQDVEVFYQRYEHFLRRRFHESRESAETDDQLLYRLQRRNDVPPATLLHIHTFVERYRRVRFGDEEVRDLEKMLSLMEKDV